MVNLASEDEDQFVSTVNQLLAKSICHGETWFLIGNKWFSSFRRFFGIKAHALNALLSSSSSPCHPGPIDNSDIILENSFNELKPDLFEETDYSLVCSDLWTLLVEKFEMYSGQKPISRKVISTGAFISAYIVEVYLLELNIKYMNDTKVLKFSQTDTLETVHKKILQEFSVDSNAETRMICEADPSSPLHLSNMSSTLKEEGVVTKSPITLEKKTAGNKWPSDASGNNNKAPCSVSYIPKDSTAGGSTSKYKFGPYSDNFNSEKSKPGVCGLSNLGNTCFMNSIIQGLSNIPSITEYFVNDNYIEDINKDNPLGMKGEIANSFGQMIKSLWSGNHSYFSPNKFKSAVGRFAPQFSGYQQQDSQELLTFLLDGLHEDLNRIRKKPYIEIKDSANRPDEEVAAESWGIYKQRNDSVILDIFHGLLKSTLVCPECDTVSVTFDPFCYLSLPLPDKKDRQIKVCFVYMDPNELTHQYTLTVPKNGTIEHLRKALSKRIGINSKCMVVADIFKNKFHTVYKTTDSLSFIKESENIFIYEIPPPSEDEVLLHVYFRIKNNTPLRSPTKLFGQPFIMAVDKNNTTPDILYNKVLSRIRRFVTPPDSSDKWWKSNQNGSSESSSDSQDLVQMDEDEGLGEDSEESNPSSSHQWLFKMSFLNEGGNVTVKDITYETNPLEFSHTKLCLDWIDKAMDLFYDDKSCQKILINDPVQTSRHSKDHSVKLDECLSLYTTIEQLGENDAWYCPKCARHQQATKKFDLWSLPSVLVISLKRFSYAPHWRQKLEHVVEFPIKGLDMSPYIINSNHGPAIYDLVAVSNHYGGMGGGHYTAFGKNKNDGEWYSFDDTVVSVTSEQNVATKAAYVLFYQRRESEMSCSEVNDIKETNGINKEDEEIMDTN